MPDPNLSKQENDFLDRLYNYARRKREREELLQRVGRHLEINQVNNAFPQIETPDYDLGGDNYYIAGRYNDLNNRLKLMPARFIGAKNYDDSVSTLAHELGHWVGVPERSVIETEEQRADNLGYTFIDMLKNEKPDSLFNNYREMINRRLLRSNIGE